MTATTPLSLPDHSGLKSPFAALHHVALVTNDMEKTVAFYRDVLGSEIAMAHRMNREGEERHYFITMAPNVVFAFFEFPDAELPEPLPATMPKSGRSLDHICFHVPSLEDWQEWKSRLTNAGVEVHDAGGRASFFFNDPNNIVIEVAVGSTNPGFPIHDDPKPAY
jgi:catechol 2,3-dioxygenase-like lactoylglutathione lyase family enzyme